MPRYGCAGLLTSDSYVPGAMVVAHGLRTTGWPHETLLHVTPEVSASSRRWLERAWDRVEEVERISVESRYGTTANFTKLWFWRREEYDRLIYLDLDVAVLGTLDELLERPRFAAAPTMWPPDRFNAGVMVLEPDLDTFEDLRSKMGTLSSTTGGDQGFLNAYFEGWYEGPSAHRLPVKFNTPALLWWFGPEWNAMRPDLRVVHYGGRAKPWDRGPRGGVRRWVERLASRRPRVGDRPTPFEIWDAQWRCARERWP